MSRVSDRSAQRHPKTKASTRVMQSFRMNKLRGTNLLIPNFRVILKVEYLVAEAVFNKNSIDVWMHVPPGGGNMNLLIEIGLTSLTALSKCNK